MCPKLDILSPARSLRSLKFQALLTDREGRLFLILGPSEEFTQETRLYIGHKSITVLGFVSTILASPIDRETSDIERRLFPQGNRRLRAGEPDDDDTAALLQRYGQYFWSQNEGAHRPEQLTPYKGPGGTWWNATLVLSPYGEKVEVHP